MADVWSVVLVVSESRIWGAVPAMLAGLAALISYFNQRIAKSSHMLINQRFTDLETINGGLREEIAALRTARDAQAGQAAALLELASLARALVKAEAVEAADKLAQEIRARADEQSP